MSTLILESREDVGRALCALIAEHIREHPLSRLALSSGQSPLLTYSLLQERVDAGSLDFSKAALFMLDEYCGLAPDDLMSYRSYFREHLIPLRFGAVHELNPEMESACSSYQALLDEAPLDLVVLGLGRNGHVAFNEPGSLPSDGVRRVRLDAMTRADAASSFGDLAYVPEYALTLGLADILKARNVVVLACGAQKREALAHLLNGPEGGEALWPVACLRYHPCLTVLCDPDAKGSSTQA